MNGYGKYFAILSGAVNVIVVMVLALWYFSGEKIGVQPPSPPVSYADFISILLTALAVLLTALAISLAVVGVFGFESIKRAVVERATSVANDIAKREVQAYLDTQERRENAGNAQLASVLEQLSAKLDSAVSVEMPAADKAARTSSLRSVKRLRSAPVDEGGSNGKR